MSVVIPSDVQETDSLLYQQYLDTFVAKFKRHIAYGTAGFRDDAKYLEHICLRVGIFMGLFAKLETHQILGIQITASHNPIRDNGIKISDFDGGMIRNSLELQVEKFVVEPNLQEAISQLLALLNTFKGYNLENQGMIVVGYDTRPSCGRLVGLIEQGIRSVGTIVRNMGEVTTPMLLHNVWFFNQFPHNLTRGSWTEQFTASYFNTYWTFFDEYMQAINFTKKEDEHILLDCSNGVGGYRMHPFTEALQKYYNFSTINDSQRDQLNEHCGAEFLHKSQTFPTQAVDKLKTYPDISKVRCVSYDGDADRIVYFLAQEGLKEIQLLDGDKMISLFALYFKTQLQKLQASVDAVNQTGAMIVNIKPSTWSIGMVQTPYANGSSSIYLTEKLGLTVFFSPNGVKNLHPNAHKYDVGIYCESNGHGTFLVKESRTKELEEFANLDDRDIETTSEEAKQAVKNFLFQASQLYRFIRIQNQSVGDAITNMLCIEAALATLNMTGQDYLGLYSDLKCQNSKVVIKDKSKLRMSYAEDKVIEPAYFQTQIDEIIAKYPGSRGFIRPSGTEDIVRIYAESNEQAVVDAITKEIKDLILADKLIN